MTLDDLEVGRCPYCGSELVEYMEVDEVEMMVFLITVCSECDYEEMDETEQD